MFLIPSSIAVSSFSSTSTLTNCTSGISSARAAKTGAMRWHGPHHVAVKSTTVSLFSAMAASKAALSASMATPPRRRSTRCSVDSFWDSVYMRLSPLIELLQNPQKVIHLWEGAAQHNYTQICTPPKGRSALTTLLAMAEDTRELWGKGIS